MIFTLLTTLLIEGVVVLLYCVINKRTVSVLLQAGLIVNVFTQVVLWFLLQVFFHHYMITLIVVEVLIWLVEGLFLYWFPGSKLKFSQAMILSLCMNAASFGTGWFLPV